MLILTKPGRAGVEAGHVVGRHSAWTHTSVPWQAPGPLYCTGGSRFYLVSSWVGILEQRKWSKDNHCLKHPIHIYSLGWSFLTELSKTLSITYFSRGKRHLSWLYCCNILCFAFFSSCILNLRPLDTFAQGALNISDRT